MNAIHTITATATLFAIGSALAAPLHAENEKPGEELTVRVMTYNVCRGGTYWGQPLSQSAKMIELAQAGDGQKHCTGAGEIAGVESHRDLLNAL